LIYGRDRSYVGLTAFCARACPACLVLGRLCPALLVPGSFRTARAAELDGDDGAGSPALRWRGRVRLEHPPPFS
jgi:hypothetical protein